MKIWFTRLLWVTVGFLLMSLCGTLVTITVDPALTCEAFEVLRLTIQAYLSLVLVVGGLIGIVVVWRMPVPQDGPQFKRPAGCTCDETTICGTCTEFVTWLQSDEDVIL